ncbi:hypothetical protein DL770_009902 [Monosporascus sp. CRB-9-2]|nr:hypothetical protein DL770_009902 [Monosporascus sp. CRB-9-2]
MEASRQNFSAALTLSFPIVFFPTALVVRQLLLTYLDMGPSPVIGFLGGCQQGLMMCEAAAPLDVQVATLEARNVPAKRINRNGCQVSGSFKDSAKIKELAARCDILTVETEQIITEVLEEIGTRSVKVYYADGTRITKKVGVTFKAQLLSILNEPLPEELEPHMPSGIKINTLGGANSGSHQRLVEKATSMYSKEMAVYLHLYGKESKPSRKISRITITGFVSIAELEKFAQPLTKIADEIRQERLQASSKTLCLQQGVNPPVKTKGEA